MNLIHFSSQPLGPIHSVTEQPDGWKPQGLWFSVEGGDDGWKAWCESEQFALASLARPHRLELHPSAKIRHLSTAADLDGFTKKHGRPRGEWYLDISWQEVAAIHQGIIIAPYIWDRRLDNRTHWYYSWDCASGCIWDASAIQSVTLNEEQAAAA